MERPTVKDLASCTASIPLGLYGEQAACPVSHWTALPCQYLPYLLLRVALLTGSPVDIAAVAVEHGTLSGICTLVPLSLSLFFLLIP